MYVRVRQTHGNVTVRVFVFIALGILNDDFKDLCYITNYMELSLS
jgi:hypothetical protein